MVEYDIKKVHEKILHIALALDKVCQEHHLTYYLWAGTMIGAVRHEGFIPWDDDMDIAMPREDYDKFIRHASEWMPAPYELVCTENDDSYPLPFAKIQDSSTTLIERAHLKYLGGIYLDLFPIDGAPSNGIARKWHFAKYEYWKRTLYLVHRDPYKHGHGISSWVPLLVRKMYTMREVQDKISKLLHQYPYSSSRLVADYDDGSKGTMEKSVLGVPQPYTFEGRQLLGVEKYDAYLGNKYGDYMTIPDQSHQRQHCFHYLDLEHSYKDFKDQ